MIEIPEIDKLKNRFGNGVIDATCKSATRATITINPPDIITCSEYLFKELKFRFIIATAMATHTGIEILYHFSKDSSGLILNIRVILDKENAVIDSLTGLFEASNWIEREMHEIMGINFLNHPNLDKLLSQGNWAEGVFPYRKSEKE
jgi:NADH:ubiquinone oxidoreductase subunit C